jgi:hypothetical protein
VEAGVKVREVVPEEEGLEELYLRVSHGEAGGAA